MNKRTNKPSFISNIKKYKYAYLLILPALVAVFLFSYIPYGGIVLAFKEFKIDNLVLYDNPWIGIWKCDWVGFDNFIKIFSDPDMLLAVKNTLVYGCVLVFFSFPFPILLALMYDELRQKRFKKITQTIMYMPHFLSWISVVGLFYVFFSTEGTLNMWLADVIPNFEKKNILLDADNFLPILFWSGIWKNIGWNSVLYLAAIAGVDQGLYEAAKIDGCGRLRQIWHVTLPGIRNTVVISLIMGLGGLVTVNFEQVFGFQNTFIQEQTEIIGTVVYRQGIQNGQYSLATAFGIAQGLVTMALVLSANAISKKLMKISIW